MVIKMKAVIKANGRFFLGFFISPVLTSTDSKPPKANISSNTEVVKDENWNSVVIFNESG